MIKSLACNGNIATIPAMGKILVIGDSHSLFWRGADTLKEAPFAAPGIDILHCAAATAFGLTRTDAKYRRVTEKAIHKARDQYAAVVLSFGEIDCRAHIVKHASGDIEREAQRVADAYLAAIEGMRAWNRDCPIILFGPPASTPTARNFSWPAYPTVGTEAERNRVAKAFTDRIKREYPTISLLDEMVDDDFATHDGVLFDGVHISARLFPLALKRLRVAIGPAWKPLGGGNVTVACEPAVERA